MELARRSKICARQQVHFSQTNQHDDCIEKQRVWVSHLYPDSARQTPASPIRSVSRTIGSFRQGYLRENHARHHRGYKQ